MGITINGRHISGNNITIINGKIIGGDELFGKSQKVDEKKSASADGIERITIASISTSINIEVSNGNTIEAHLSGNFSGDGNRTFNLTRVGNELKISVKLNGYSLISNLSFHVKVPARLFKTISVKSENGNVTIDNNVNANMLHLDSTNGNVKSYGFFKEIKAHSENGNLEICVHARNDVKMNVSSENGNVKVSLHNIAKCNLFISSINGYKFNHYTPSLNGYVASGRISSENGNVKVM